MSEIKINKPSDVEIITKNQFNTSAEFSDHIEKMVLDNRSSYIDCIIDFCERNNIDIEVVSKLITKNLKEKIKTEAVNQNLISKKISKRKKSKSKKR